jgi:hypothetical protein
MTPTLRVVEVRPGRRALLIALVGAIVIAIAIAGYELGRSHTERRLAEAREMETALARARETITELERRLADHELSRTVDGSAQEELRQSIKSLRDELAESREELRFYRQLMAPSEAERGLRVERLELWSRSGGQAVSYRVLLTQVVDRHQWLTGTVRLEVRGLQEDAEQVLPLTDLGWSEAYPLAFKFRYFQDLSGTLLLPDGFRPTAVTVVAEISGANGKRVERAFPWNVQEG